MTISAYYTPDQVRALYEQSLKTGLPDEITYWSNAMQNPEGHNQIYWSGLPGSPSQNITDQVNIDAIGRQQTRPSLSYGDYRTGQVRPIDPRFQPPAPTPPAPNQTAPTYPAPNQPAPNQPNIPTPGQPNPNPPAPTIPTPGQPNLPPGFGGSSPPPGGDPGDGYVRLFPGRGAGLLDTASGIRGGMGGPIRGGMGQPYMPTNSIQAMMDAKLGPMGSGK